MDRGVSKYDGRYLTNYSVNQGLSSDVVHCVLEDKSGNIWIGTTDAGVNKFDRKYITRLDTFGIVGFSEVNFRVKV